NARNFANKLWNATRFVLGARPATIPAGAARVAPDRSVLGPGERWILSRAAATVGEADRAFADYQFAELTRALYDGIWSEFCDWGLELAKVRLADSSLPDEVREATWWTLVSALDTYLRLLHPVMPFVTEQLWGALPHRASDPGLLIVARWPAPTGRDERVEAEVEARTWLPTEVAVPAAMGPTFEALRPAIERLARARPLERRLSREALGQGSGSGDGA